MTRNKQIFEILKEHFPNAKCELDYQNIFQLIIAVVLSAQTTDKSVNKITPKLFEKYPSPEMLSKAEYDDVYSLIKTIGLAKTKTKNIINLAKALVERFDSTVPNNFDELVTLPGVGRKTANVILSEGFNIPRIAVDTHVLRVSNRLELVNSDDVVVVEKELSKLYPIEDHHKLHLALLFFGRYLCKAISPDCSNCPIAKANISCTKKR